MRILHVIQGLDPADGGLPKAVLGLACAQLALGDVVGLLSHTQSSAAAKALRAFGWMPGFSRLDRLDIHPSGIAERLFCREAIDRMRRWRPDVVQIHGVWMPLMRNLAAACRRGGIPYTVTFHGMFHPSLHRQKRLAKFVLWRLLGWNRLVAGARWIQALNAEEKATLDALRFPPPVRVHANGIFPEELGPAPVEEGNAAASTQPPHILFLGRLHDSKGVRLLLEAYILAAPGIPHDLVLAGPDGGLGPSLRHRAEVAGVAGRVHFPGPVYGMEKLALLRDADVVALTSPSEGFSLSISEAAAAGKALVITTGCHFGPLAAAGGALECPPDAQAIAHALTGLAGDPGRRASLGANARQYMATRHAWSAIAAGMRKDLLPLAKAAAVDRA